MSRNVICIEDDRNAATLIEKELSDRDFEITSVSTGEEGLLAIMKSTPDLILCDISLPGMSGFEVLGRLNELAPRLGKIPFVLISETTDRENELKGRQLGADDYIRKPIDFDRLALIIEARILGTARARRSPKLPRINDREVEVLTWVARGNTSAEIARKLHLSKRTIEFHIENARVKLHAATRTEAVVRAVAGGLIKL